MTQLEFKILILIKCYWMKNHMGIFWFISYKTLAVAKPLHIRFNKVDGFIRDYDETRHLVSFGPEKYDVIYNRTRYLIK